MKVNGNHKYVAAASSVEVSHGTSFPVAPDSYVLFRLDPPTAGSGLYWYSGTTWMKFCLPAQDLIVGESPAGALDGTNKVFTLAYTPVKVEGVYLNGLFQDPLVSSSDYPNYSYSGTTLTMTVAPLAGDKLRVTYFK